MKCNFQSCKINHREKKHSTPQRKKAKPFIAWVGVCDGKMDLEKVDLVKSPSWDGYERLYKTKDIAKRFYEYTVRVRILVQKTANSISMKGRT